MIEPRAKLHPIVASGISHDDLIVAKHAGKRIQSVRRNPIRRPGLSQLDRAPLLRRKPDEAVARSQSSFDRVGLAAVGFTRAGRGRYVELRFQLIDKLK